ncbi:MAG: histone deacetylase [Solirubrobacterales bacterium]|nr:histone deacetylase [Solirubrobacterales bacterium]MBV9715251.1 histone deacetylase [Solirubrobacterales bacterium]
MLYFRHPSSLEHDPGAAAPGHPDAPARITAIEAALEREGWKGCERRSAPCASESELELVHAPAHVESIRTLAGAGGGQLDADTWLDESSYRAARHAAGGAGEMVRALIAGHDTAGFCGLRPAGHHAERDRAMGFCVFNNVALAAELAVRELGLERVMIIDWDVHHGNGTAEIFRRRSDVLFASIHESGLFPGTGAAADVGAGDARGYTINVPVPRDSDEEVWLSVLEYVIVPVGLEFRPQLVLVSAGYDAHRADPVGGCRLEAESYGQMTCHVRDMAAEVGAPVGAVLEGGYDPDALAVSVLATISALCGEGTAESIAPDPLVTSRVAAHVGHFWTL